MEGERLMIQINNFTIPVQEQEKLRVLDIDKPHAKAEIALLGRNGPLVASVEVMEVQAPWKAPQPGEYWQDAILANLDRMAVNLQGDRLEAGMTIHAMDNGLDISKSAEHKPRAYQFHLVLSKKKEETPKPRSRGPV